MGSQWLMSTLLLTSLSCVEGHSGAAGKSSWDDNVSILHSFSSPVVTTSLISLPFKTEGGLLPADKYGRKMDTTPKDFVVLGVARAGNESANTPIMMTLKERSSRTLDIRSDKDTLLRPLTAETSASHVTRAHERQEAKDDLVLARDSREAVPQDQLHNPAEDLPMNTTDDTVSPDCGHLSQSPDALSSSWNESWNSNGRWRRRSHFQRGSSRISCRNCSLALSLAKASGGDLSLVELVLYLISLTSGRQFYLVYDDATPGVEDVVRGALQKVFGDTILLPYEPSLLLLTKALTSDYHVQPMRNVFILCSAKHVVNVFEQVRKRVLESPTIQWFVIMDQDMTKDLPVVLREGTQVALVQRLTPKEAQLFSSRVNPDGQIRFHQVGSWPDSRNGLNSYQVKGGLVPDLQELYSNLEGRHLLISTNDNWPFFKIQILKNGTVIPFYGIDFSILKALSEKLNFTIQMVTSPDGHWGVPMADGTVNGLVGQVARHEAHATACEVTITDVRESVVDFTMPYYMESMTLVTLAPKEKNRAFAILSPFTIDVWLYIFLATVLVGPLLYMVSRLLVVYLGEEDGPHYSLQSFSFNMFRNLVLQGNLINSHRWTLRFVFISWYLFCFYIYTMYSGTLTAALAIVSFEKPIDSLYDLARAHRDGYTIATGIGSNYETTLREAKSGIYKEVWELFNHEDLDKSLVPSRNVGLDLVERYKYVYLNAQLSIRMEVIRRGRHRFYMAKETFLPQGYGIACSSGSPLRDVFSRVVIRLTEVGLIVKWANDEVMKVSHYVSPTSSSGPGAITLQHLQAAFFITVLGFAISALVLILEILGSATCQTI